MRDDVTEHPINATIAYKIPQANSPVPRLEHMSVELKRGDSLGEYTMFSTNATIPGGLSSESTIDITGGGYTEGFKRVKEIGAECRSFEGSCDCSRAEPHGSSSTPAPTSETLSDDTSETEGNPDCDTSNSEEAPYSGLAEPLAEAASSGGDGSAAHFRIYGQETLWDIAKRALRGGRWRRTK